MLLSIVVPAFNEDKWIENTIKQIKAALQEIDDKDFSSEIIVCDNNSTDKTAELASYMGAIIVSEPISQISRARNKGAEIAKGDWFLFIDADSYPSGKLMIDVLELIRAGKHIGCGSTIQVEGGTLFNKLRMERLNPISRLLNLCGGAFILCEREAFESIHGFSTNLFAYEEVDFIIRLKRYGRRDGKKFCVLQRNPVITSGRKGDYKFFPLLVLFVSNFVAIFLFALHYILPQKLMQKIGSRWLGYWYKTRR